MTAITTMLNLKILRSTMDINRLIDNKVYDKKKTSKKKLRKKKNLYFNAEYKEKVVHEEYLMLLAEVMT